MAKSFMKIKKGVSLQSLPTPPIDPVNGDYYYNDSGGLQIYHNNVWRSVGFVAVELDDAATYLASSGQQVLISSTTQSLALDLPAAPIAGDRIRIIDAGAGAGSFNAFPVTIDGNGKTIQGQTDVTISSDGFNVELVYSSLSDWRVF